MDNYVLIAKSTVEYFTKTGKVPKIEGDSVVFGDSQSNDFSPIKIEAEMLSRRAGTFATIHEKNGDLRGCIGTIIATKSNIAEEIIHNAISSCSRDPRFPPVQPDELENLTYSVDVLGEIENVSSPNELDVKKYGVIVTCGYRRGLLLPNLDGVDDVETQISIARRKGGISPDEKVELARFEVVRHL